MTDSEGIVPHEAEFLLYQTEDGRARVQVRFDGETAWLTQAGLAELFQTTPQNITQHIAAIYAERELEEAPTCKSYLQVHREGSRQVRRRLKHLALLDAAHITADSDAEGEPVVSNGIALCCHVARSTYPTERDSSAGTSSSDRRRAGSSSLDPCLTPKVSQPCSKV